MLPIITKNVQYIEYLIAGNFQGIFISRISQTNLNFESTTQTLSIAKKNRENCFLDISNESKFVKYRALENSQLYGSHEVRLCTLLCLYMYVLYSLCVDLSIFTSSGEPLRFNLFVMALFYVYLLLPSTLSPTLSLG